MRFVAGEDGTTFVRDGGEKDNRLPGDWKEMRQTFVILVGHGGKVSISMPEGQVG